MAGKLNFDDVEALLEDAAKDPREGKSNSQKDRSRSRDKDRRKDRSRSRDRRERRAPREVLNEDEQEAERERKRQEQRLREEEMERKKAIEDAERGDRTVMVAGLAVKVDERDLYEFFTGAGAKVSDVQIIRDARTGRSKGVGYIEFTSQEAAHRAVGMNGQTVRGHTLHIQPSHAERNRAANAPTGTVDGLPETPLRLFVGGLVGKLANFSEEKIRKLFTPFGEIELVEMSIGFAFVQYKRASEGRAALASMNKFEVAGQELQVGVATADMQPGSFAGKPATKAPSLAILPPPEDIGTPSQFLSLKGMFDPKEVNLKKEPKFFEELEEEVGDECKKFGKLKAVHAPKRKNVDGMVYLRYDAVTAATNCRSALDKRYFGGIPIVAKFITEEAFKRVRSEKTDS